MSVLVVGLSHRSAPVEVLERAAVAADRGAQAARRAAARPARVRGRCCSPRATASRSTRSSTPSTAASPTSPRCSARHAGMPLAELTEHLYVHYAGAGRAAPVRGRRRARLDGRRRGADPRPAARRLRRRRRAPAPSGGRCTSWPSRRCGSASGCTPSTGIDAAGRLGRLRGARRRRRRARRRSPGGARWSSAPGAMGGLAAAAPAPRRGRPRSSCSTAPPDRAARLAEITAAHGTPARAGALDALAAELAAADLVVACTGAVGTVVELDTVAAAVAARAGRPLAVCDLGLPRDVDPARRRRCPASRVIDLAALQRRLADGARGAAVAARPGAGRRGGAGLPRRAALRRGHARRSPRCAGAPPR